MYAFRFSAFANGTLSLLNPNSNPGKLLPQNLPVNFSLCRQGRTFRGWSRHSYAAEIAATALETRFHGQFRSRKGHFRCDVTVFERSLTVFITRIFANFAFCLPKKADCSPEHKWVNCLFHDLHNASCRACALCHGVFSPPITKGRKKGIKTRLRAFEHKIRQ